MFRSATFKLTMWYLAIVMAISLSFSLVLYHVTTQELSRGLRRETQRIDTEFPIFHDSPMLRPELDYNDGAHRILLRLIGFNVIVLAGAGLASYWLARRTLLPIEEAHEQQKRFTSDVSHELRTPLTALRMESEVALLNPSAGKQELRKTLESNLEEVSKLEALINNLLRLTRLEVEELQHAFTDLSSASLADSAIRGVQKIAAHQNIQLVNQVTDASVIGDHNSLVQLLVVLLDNAIKYSPPNSQVTVTSKLSGNEILIHVIDTGVGIEPAALEHVFDRFYRADSSRVKSDSEGYGLGLSIAKMIADLHHGALTLTSRVGHGTTATITLPKALDKPASSTKD